MNALDLIRNGAGLYEFDNGGGLLVWPARLLYDESRAVSAAVPSAVREPSFSEFEYPQRGGSVVQPPARSPASPDINLREVDIVGRSQTGRNRPNNVSTRPNVESAFEAAQGYIKENPLLEEWEITSLGDSVLEPFVIEEQTYQGMFWVIQILSLAGFDGELISLDRVRQFKAEASARVLWVHLASRLGDEGTAGLLHQFKQTEYRGLKADFQRFEARVRRDAEQWKAYGAVPVVDEYQRIQPILTAANVSTALVALHGLLSLFSTAKSFLQGVDEVIGCFDALQAQISESGGV